MNVKNHHTYSDRFILNVVDLTKIDMATSEDKDYQIDYWARLFKARTGEDLKMIAKKMQTFAKLCISLQTCLSHALHDIITSYNYTTCTIINKSRFSYY